MRRFRPRAAFLAAALASSCALHEARAADDAAPAACARPQTQAAAREDHSAQWAIVRDEFYSQDQGSRIMPLAWMRALKTTDGRPFLEDGLARYFYLPNPVSPANPEGLPVGFHVSGTSGARFVGVTCAACHTREISVGGETRRIDGGPALADFQRFLVDLDEAALRVLRDPAAFAVFAPEALGVPDPDAIDVETLRLDLAAWSGRYHALISRALDGVTWGRGRLDAVSMIFNRLTGLDLGEDPTRLIADNIHRAGAPTRYPFLWNAARQDKTQWPGFADNGSDILALPRNLGEVLGVFAAFEPAKSPALHPLLQYDYLSKNSANFDGLAKLERWMRLIDPPKWPFGPLDAALVEKGAGLFESRCAQCHGEAPGQTQFPNVKTWRTCLADVGTDRAEYLVLTRRANPGALEGAQIPGLVQPLAPDAFAVDVLAVATLGSILQNHLRETLQNPLALLPRLRSGNLPPSLDGLQGAFRSIQHIKELSKGFDQPATKFPYEARVLYGIWAAAPYLHNGSVASLDDLLKPAAQRRASFSVGPAYDVEKVGLAETQPDGATTLTTTGCEDVLSGDSRCGHEYGTDLDDADRRALIEYLKQL
ncbi:di-heme-cytochrome C peroxidase [Methylocella sp.]|uniref:di-heme-cytochrome C peroxidase n=1 Tax=Methylocella sp. TaxID=1978226 RepID=UPI0035B30F0C